MFNIKSIKSSLIGLGSSKLFLPILSTLITCVLYIAVFNYYYADKIYPGVSVAGTKVSGLTTQEAEKVVSEKLDPKEEVGLIADNNTFTLSLKDVDFQYTTAVSVGKAFEQYRKGNFLQTHYLNLMSPLVKTDIPVGITINENKLNEFLQVISNQLDIEPEYPKAALVDETVEIDKGKAGEYLAADDFIMLLKKHLIANDFSPISIPFKSTDPTLTDEQAEVFKGKAESFLGKSLILNYDYDSLIYKDDKLLPLLDPYDTINDKALDEVVLLEAQNKFNHEPQNAVFNFENGKVVEFKPAKDGVVVDTEKLAQDIKDNLQLLSESEDDLITIDVPVKTEKPKITTEQVNDLGIKQLIGRGSSTFKGSISSRMHNIALAASKFNGVLVNPGEIFSFNNTLGDVSTYTGYKQAYVIKDGRTVLGDGGGVCQVSTTFFRAILNSGLPVVERRAHSYRVSYYEQDAGPGLDATVYAPTTDLKFRNDTPRHLLIQTQFDGNNSKLVFEIYGTSDGRVAEITKPVILSTTPPPDDLYIDDPTLPEGQIKQVEHKVWGAKTVFSYKVTKDGEIMYEKDFVSNFRPWQAVYMRGTGPVN